MNCIFCHNLLQKPKNELSFSSIICTICPHKTKFYPYSMPHAILYVQFTVDQYIIELSVERKTCEIYGNTSNGFGVIICLDYLPCINPNNVEDWVKRIFDMKAFF